MVFATCIRYTLYCVIIAAATLLWNMSISRKDSVKQPVIIVGGGLAGLSATIEAVRHGAIVTIIEKESKLGGNSAKATSGINAIGTDAQINLKIEDSIPVFIQDTISSGDGMADKALVKTLAENSKSAIQFLSSFGLDLTDVVQLGGHSAKRTHRFPPTKEGKPLPVGFTIMSTLRKYVENDLKDSVTIFTRSNFKNLVIENDAVVGLRYTDIEGIEKELRGTVILTAGGFANDHTDTSLLQKYTPNLSRYPTTNGPWATGDIIKAVEPDGISLIHMDRVQIHPTGFVDPKDPKFHTKFLAPEALRGCGGLLLNDKGQRFVNELGRRDHISEKILKECETYGSIQGNPKVATMLLTEKMIDKFGSHLAGFYIFKGFIKKAGNLSSVAKILRVTEETLKETINDYNNVASTGQDQFGKKAFPTLFNLDNDVFYVAYITPTLHYCMGGIQINTKSQVLRDKGSKVTPGVYAAGEVSGGVHGNNRLGGNSLLECVVYGRIAGKEAAHLKQ